MWADFWDTIWNNPIAGGLLLSLITSELMALDSHSKPNGIIHFVLISVLGFLKSVKSLK
jgi:hypothetical protein